MNPTLIDFTRCAYHTQHDQRQVKLTLSDHKLLDVPKVRVDLDKTLDLTVYAWDHYTDYDDGRFDRFDYCPAADVVSFCIERQGIWEGYETLAVLDILRTPGLVVDVGAHIGWYMALASAAGCDTLGIEANSESVNLAGENAMDNAVGDATPSLTMSMVETLKPSPPEPIRLFISDVEGAEVEAVEYCRASFSERLVDFALLEMSPVFNDSYPQLTALFNSWGYQGFQVPHKGEQLVEYGLDPLGVLLSQRPITPEVVAGWRQESAVFVSPDAFTLLT